MFIMWTGLKEFNLFEALLLNFLNIQSNLPYFGIWTKKALNIKIWPIKPEFLILCNPYKHKTINKNSFLLQNLQEWQNI